MVENLDNTVLLSSGYKMPLLGLGTWNQKDPEAINLGLTEIGYRHIDCANQYQNEELVGKALKAAFEKGLKREEIFVTTKLWGSNFEDPEAALKESLKKLQLEYVDMYIIHYPSGYWNGKVPLHVLWPKLEELRDKHLARSIGVANFNLQLIADLMCYARISPAVNYIELSPLNPQTELVKFLKDLSIQPVSYCLLANKAGDNANYASGYCNLKEAPNLLEDKDVLEMAEKYKKTPFQIVLRWGLDRGHAVIPKATERKHLEENFNIFDFKLTQDQVEKLTKKDLRLRVCNKLEEAGGYDIFA